MVGSETSGNRASQPINSVRLMLTVQLLDFIQSLPNPKGIPTEFLVCRDFLEAHKEAFIQKFGQEVYDAHLERYSRNRTEMHEEKKKKRLEVEARRSERLALKRKDLDLRARELELRENSVNSKEVRELEEILEDTVSQLEDLKTMEENDCQRLYGMSKTEREQQLLSQKESVTKQINELS